MCTYDSILLYQHRLQITAKNISPEKSPNENIIPNVNITQNVNITHNENITSNISVTTPKSQTTQPVTAPLYLTAEMMGRLGNQMFIYANLLGLAIAQNRRPFLRDGQDLVTTFQVSYINGGITNASYFTHAFSKMRSLLPNQNITFLVASEDQEWCKQNLNDSSVRVLPPGSAAEHMAILASCDHVIITGGTYSFMAAWLANGITIYNTKHYSQTAPVRVGFTDADFFLPGWIGVE
ncbi:Galactoside 2-alpha-L-fucosyltransferase 2 [Bulinus truncatus]|nr:Galactoside 2-alpha-L-fucosyltransferase 2 [Bulinus truncatus]